MEIPLFVPLLLGVAAALGRHLEQCLGHGETMPANPPSVWSWPTREIGAVTYWPPP